MRPLKSAVLVANKIFATLSRTPEQFGEKACKRVYTEMNSARLIVAFAVALCLFVIPSAASATVTTTNITTPADNSIVVWDSRTDTGTSSIVGTAPGATDGDLVDILCYGSHGFVNVIAEDVPVTAGAFSLTDLSSGAGGFCRLRAVPADTTPANTPTPFAGPLVEIDEISLSLENPEDPGNLKPTGFYVYAGQIDASMNWGAAGDGGFEGELVDLATFSATEEVFDGTHHFNGLNGGNTESPIQIDGVNGWLTTNLSGAGYINQPNFPTLSIDPIIDTQTGDMTLYTSEGLITCTNDTTEWWVSGQECPPLLETGVRLDRSIKQSEKGGKAVVVDRWVSIDGQPHTISLKYREEFRFDDDEAPAAQFQFPGHSPITSPADGSTVSGPFPDNSMIYVNDPAYPDGSTLAGRAGIKMRNGADSAFFYADGFDTPEFALVYANRTIPAGGALEITTEFYQAFSQARLEELAAVSGGGGTNPPADTPALPTITGAKRAKATASRGKKPRVTISTSRSVNCPAGGSACTATAALTTKIKTRVKGKTRTKTVKLGTFEFEIPAGTSKRLVFKLPASSTKHLRKKSFNVENLIVTKAGTGREVSVKDSYTVKPPKIKK